MQINYFYFEKKEKIFQIISEFISKDQLESNYNIKEIDFKGITCYPSAVYNVTNLGIFCLSTEDKDINEDFIDAKKYNLKFSVYFYPFKEIQLLPNNLDSVSFLEVQAIFSSLIDSGVGIKSFSCIEKNTIEFSLESNSLKKLYSDFYFSKFFISKLFDSRVGKFLVGFPGKKDQELYIYFEKNHENLKKNILQEFSNLSSYDSKIKAKFSNENFFIDSLLQVVKKFSL